MPGEMMGVNPVIPSLAGLAGGYLPDSLHSSTSLVRGGCVVDRKVALEEVSCKRVIMASSRLCRQCSNRGRCGEKLQTENRELRQQLVDLRAGRGIYIEIANQRFELAWESTKTNAQTTETPTGKRSQTSKNVKNAPPPPTMATMASSGVLEEMLLDEFSSAMDNHMGPTG